ncbi:hypothetical protein P886_1482 [Alteromonadaceae bacterium 2753L.S.0a.02]|nr:hypothetical protein P886_1482 [Alteromonadaceae bacterium 2753L.S.0a.02]
MSSCFVAPDLVINSLHIKKLYFPDRRSFGRVSVDWFVSKRLFRSRNLHEVDLLSEFLDLYMVADFKHIFHI